MSEQTQSNQILVVNSELSKQVISEYDLLRVLNIERSCLDELRYKHDFPVVCLNRANRVYLLRDILGWMERHKGYTQRGVAGRSEA